MQETPKISGFTIVRNAELLDYPLKESILSVLPLCDEFIINCGRSTDQTLQRCKELQKDYPQKIKIFETEWEIENQKGGLQLSSQTNFAASQCASPWCFYIQADEAVHEEDFESIRKTVLEAEKRPDVDGVVFDYIHFYGNYHWAIEGRNWYRKEIRLFKNSRGIKSFRDAQGFRKNGQRLLGLESHARVFHYGYVRTPESLQTKSTEMARWWGSQVSSNLHDFRLINHVGLYRFKKTHPQAMLNRIQAKNWDFDPSKAPRKWDRTEIKNLITFAWEKIFRFRIGEFRNYEIA